MVLYKLDCDSNDCELLSGQATPSTVAKGVACSEAAWAMGWASRLLIECHIRAINRAARWLVRARDSPGPFVLATAGCWQLT